ncbi:GNAT family N-acetyltransferase [Paractinoplanes atraurantiacus]|uniref:Acetyltransferase (GNAT) family protein n=1 Tax=Paractinoplanes atraurantiacus TaxID=1036182 RepID=A0A285JM83_9ACTN|nr:GNAT family N-acetyltransferase [Actinoplanes atraurantiacus]SNY61395.1 Acetyltransferase (GNAT) family protein [Actinoplanes atraurantiacus]
MNIDEIAEAVADWQHTGGPVQLHPGDLGWNWRFGPPAVRAWTRDGRIVAAGMTDDADGLIRMGIAPAVADDPGLAAQILADLSDPAQGKPATAVEARFGPALRDLLARSGWAADEPWTPLSRDLTEPVEDCGLRIATDVADRVAVQWAAFPNSTFTEERWHTMAAAPPYRRARCLVGYDHDDNAVAAVTVWSAGEGRPGLLEPMGVHRDHRGRGHGRAITVAAAAALREMGASAATVCTPSANAGGVATYVSAGFRKLPEVTDFRRPGE